MNGYMIFVNGLLAAPDLFQISAANSPEFGRHLRLSASADKFKEADGIKSIDVFEVRSSNIVARFRAEEIKKADGDITARGLRVENTNF